MARTSRRKSEAEAPEEGLLAREEGSALATALAHLSEGLLGLLGLGGLTKHKVKADDNYDTTAQHR